MREREGKREGERVAGRQAEPQIGQTADVSGSQYARPNINLTTMQYARHALTQVFSLFRI